MKRGKQFQEFLSAQKLGTFHFGGKYGDVLESCSIANTERSFASAIVLRIGFGVTVRSDDDPYIKIAIDANMATGGGGNPGTALVDYLPSCMSPSEKTLRKCN